MEKLNKTELALLAEIREATDSANGYGFVVLNAPATKKLVDLNLIETNDAVTDESGSQHAARITQAGRTFAATGELPAATEGQGKGSEGSTAKGSSKPEIVIESGIELPPKSRAPVSRESKYPFDDLPVGGSFFVANSDVKSGKAFESLGGTVNSAKKKYSEETGEMRPHRLKADVQVPVTRQIRTFEMRRMDKVLEDGTKVPGARIFRVE